tara:strand:- start:382 stop:624 length:243 start_codon:yes stop_codon:yes gene_type:complete
VKKDNLIQRLKWIEESMEDYIDSIGGIDNSEQFRMLNDILIACDLNDDEPEKYWLPPNSNSKDTIDEDVSAEIQILKEIK